MRKSRIRSALFALTAFAFTTQAMAGDASIWVGHGIPGEDLSLDAALPVDVLVNDSICLLSDFTFGQFVGPVALAPATYNVKISLANEATPCANGAVIEGNFDIADDETATIFAFLDEGGAPTAAKFANDISALESGKSRLVLQHTANAPMVDVAVRRGGPKSPGLLVTDVPNGAQAGVDVRPGGWRSWIYPAGSDMPVFGPARVELKPYTATFVYAVGSLDNATFTLLTNTMPTRIE